MKNRRLISVFMLLLLIGVFPLFGISFRGLDLSGDNRLLFRTDTESQYALFVSRLTDLALQQITVFPEKLELVDSGRMILAHNQFGTVMLPVSGGLPMPLPGLPSFAAGIVPMGGPEQIAASSDGRWILYVEPTSPAYGNLTLAETASGVRRIISERVELPAVDFPARWSPNSRFFVYSKGSRLYYFPMSNDPGAVIDERYRIIGNGGITSVLWTAKGDLFYFNANTLYHVRSPELFTRTIYGDFLSIGTAAGNIPLDFDSGLDRYWIAPDESSILLFKNEKSIFFIPLGENDYRNLILPHIMIPDCVSDINVLWSAAGLLTVTAASQGGEVMVWRIEISGKQVKSFIPPEIPATSRGALSPDGTMAVFWGDSGLALWDYVNWRPIQSLSRSPVFSCAWINNGEFISGGSRFIERINISRVDETLSVRRRLICLSGADEFGFEEGDFIREPVRILVKAGTAWFASNGSTPWSAVTDPRLRTASQMSGRYRVYLEEQSSGAFKNIPMIRDTVSMGTLSLLPAGLDSAAVNTSVTGKIALCFDLYDDDTGLVRVMNALRRFGIKATFFLNGDFIRRNPLAAAAIAGAGHETASLFYAPIDLSNSRYRITPEFIARGLARNEDEFFEATGKELKMLWHPPFFRTSGEITAAASAAGYRTISRDIDCGDWVGREEAQRLGSIQFSAACLIEQISEAKKPGAIIPLRLGLLPGGRDDYLFNRIDVLLAALIRAGYEIVPVSALADK